MIVKVKLGDVFYINWFRRTSSIYKLYRINYDIRQAYGVCIEDYKITRKAAFIVKQVENGIKVDDIPITIGLKIERDLGKGIKHIIELPYAFPLDNDGKPVIPPQYYDVVAEYTIVYEQRMLYRGYEDVC